MTVVYLRLSMQQVSLELVVCSVLVLVAGILHAVLAIMSSLRAHSLQIQAPLVPIMLLTTSIWSAVTGLVFAVLNADRGDVLFRWGNSIAAGAGFCWLIIILGIIGDYLQKETRPATCSIV